MARNSGFKLAFALSGDAGTALVVDNAVEILIESQKALFVLDVTLASLRRLHLTVD